MAKAEYLSGCIRYEVVSKDDPGKEYWFDEERLEKRKSDRPGGFHDAPPSRDPKSICGGRASAGKHANKLKEGNMSEAAEEQRVYKTMSPDATKEQHEAERLSHLVQTLSAERQVGLLCYLLGVISTKPEWLVLKEAVELYLKEYGIEEVIA